MRKPAALRSEGWLVVECIDDICGRYVVFRGGAKAGFAREFKSLQRWLTRAAAWVAEGKATP